MPLEVLDPVYEDPSSSEKPLCRAGQGGSRFPLCFFVMTYLLLERPYVRRLVEGRDNLRGRGVRDEGSQETLDVILDEYLLCHLGLSDTLDSQRTLVYAIADALQPTRHKSLTPPGAHYPRDFRAGVMLLHVLGTARRSAIIAGTRTCG